MKIGFFGGTFDPVHIGHTRLVEDAIHAAGLDRLLVIPAGKTVHKPISRVSSAGMRYVMSHLAFSPYAQVQVSCIEVARARESYTIDTIRELAATYDQEVEWFMLCGADILFDILHWRDPVAILRETHLLVGLRPGHDIAAVERRADQLRQSHQARITFFTARQTDVSSTSVRQAIAAGAPVRGLVPPCVEAFIHHAGLYGSDDPLAVLSPRQHLVLRTAEQVLFSWMDAERLAHSLLTMTTAARLAHAHSRDVFKAALAGLIHDCAKHLPAGEAIGYVPPTEHATRAEPKLYHGPAGAQLAVKWFDVRDPLILDAIRYHTTGRAAMTWLDLVLYLADKTEPFRVYPHAEKIRAMAESDLTGAFLYSAQVFCEELATKGGNPHPDTLAAMDWAKSVVAAREESYNKTNSSR